MKHYLCKIKDYLKIILKAMVQTHTPSAWAGNQYPEFDSSYAKGIPICLSSAHLPTSHWQVSSASKSSHGMSVLIYHDGPPLSSSLTSLHCSSLFPFSIPQLLFPTLLFPSLVHCPLLQQDTPPPPPISPPGDYWEQLHPHPVPSITSSDSGPELCPHLGISSFSDVPYSLL